MYNKEKIIDQLVNLDEDQLLEIQEAIEEILSFNETMKTWKMKRITQG